MIAIVFLLVMLAIAIFAASQGVAALPIGEIMMLVGLFLVFFGSGVYIAVVLGALALLSGFHVLRPAVLAIPGSGHLGAFIELRAGGRAALPADG